MGRGYYSRKEWVDGSFIIKTKLTCFHDPLFCSIGFYIWLWTYSVKQVEVGLVSSFFKRESAFFNLTRHGLLWRRRHPPCLVYFLLFPHFYSWLFPLSIQFKDAQSAEAAAAAVRNAILYVKSNIWDLNKNYCSS